MFVSLFSYSTFYCWARNRIKLPSPPGKISSQYLFFKKSIKSCKTVLKSLSCMGTFRPYFVDLIFWLFSACPQWKAQTQRKKMLIINMPNKQNKNKICKSAIPNWKLEFPPVTQAKYFTTYFTSIISKISLTS